MTTLTNNKFVFTIDTAGDLDDLENDVKYARKAVSVAIDLGLECTTNGWEGVTRFIIVFVPASRLNDLVEAIRNAGIVECGNGRIV